MKRLKDYYKWIVAFIFCIAVIAVYKTFDNIGNIGKAIGVVLNAFKPFFWGFVIAYLLNLPAKKIAELLKKVKVDFIRKRARGISILVIYFMALVAAGLIIMKFVPALYRNIVELSLNLPNYAGEIINRIENFEIVKRFGLLEAETIDASATINAFIGKINPDEIGKYAQSVFHMTTGIFSAVIALIASIYMLLDKERITNALIRIIRIFFKKETADNICRYAHRANEIFTSYIYCRLMCSIIMAIACTIALSIMKIKYAVVLGLFIGAMDMIPYFGSIISVVIAEIIILLTGGIWKTVWTTVTLLIMQQIDGNIMAPKIMGMSLDMRPLWIIVAVTVGGSLFGFLGMLLSVPVAAVLQTVAADGIAEYEARKKKKAEPEVRD